MTESESNSELDVIVAQVKKEFQNLLVKKKELVTKLGTAYEKVVGNPESVCEEIKNILRDEIAEKLISSRDIERYCPDKWKKKTKPKNDKLSFSKLVEEKPQQKIAVTQGGKSVDVTERSTVNTDNYDKQPEDNTQLYYQSNQKETPTGNERKSNLDIDGETQGVTGESKESEGSDGDAKRDVFDCYVAIPFEHLRKDLEAVYQKTNGIGNVWIYVNANLGTGSITLEFCGTMRQKNNAMISYGEGRMKRRGTQ
jgi:hypothetical protein